MHTAALALSAFLGLSMAFSAVGKLRRDPKVIAIMEHVGLNAGQIRALAFIELAATVGLLSTTWFATLGALAAAGSIAYFAGAVVAHARKHDPVAEVAPAVFLTLVAAVTTYAISSAF